VLVFWPLVGCAAARPNKAALAGSDCFVAQVSASNRVRRFCISMTIHATIPSGWGCDVDSKMDGQRRIPQQTHAAGSESIGR
jgi:hypothetical protein